MLFRSNCIIAHGEGRYTTMDENLISTLKDNDQILFQYCDEKGEVKNEYPTNPNGALDSIAGIINKKGNVMAIMPHPERSESGQRVFLSMRDYLLDKKIIQFKKKSYDIDISLPRNYERKGKSIEIITELIIADNEAESLQQLFKKKGKDIFIKRYTHWEISGDNLDKDKIIKSGY